MKQLKKQIGESFFNPILYFLPLLVFIVGDNFWGLDMAWKISFPVAMLTILFVYRFYNRLFVWYILLAACYVFIGLMYSLIIEYQIYTPFSFYTDDLLFIVLMLLLFFFRNTTHKIARKTLHPRMPMTNNLDELFRINGTLLVIVSFFTILFIVLELKFKDIHHPYINYVNYFYLVVMVFITLYETIRVLFIRSMLLKEDWVPIVSKQGKIIGTEPYLSRVLSEKKYMHPVVRMHIIQEGKLLLKKYADDDVTHSQMWDTAINNHVRVGESIQEALARTSKAVFNAEINNAIFLSNYSCENNVELEYVFLFVTCNIQQDNLSANDWLQFKWWTPKQIKENFNEGIFTEEFKQEYLLLERGGLISSIHCACDCELKEFYKKQKSNRFTSQVAVKQIKAN